MELSDKILSKPEINSRVVDALLAIIANGLVATKSDLAERLGSKPSKFSEILNYRMSAGVDMIAKICDWYSVDPNWILMGRGNRIFRQDKGDLAPYSIDYDNLDRSYSNEEDTQVPFDKNTPASKNESASMVEMLYSKTIEQAEEIGQLRERIAQLQREKGKDVSDAHTSGIANVG